MGPGGQILGVGHQGINSGRGDEPWGLDGTGGGQLQAGLFDHGADGAGRPTIQVVHRVPVEIDQMLERLHHVREATFAPGPECGQRRP